MILNGNVCRQNILPADKKSFIHFLMNAVLSAYSETFQTMHRDFPLQKVPHNIL